MYAFWIICLAEGCHLAGTNNSIRGAAAKPIKLCMKRIRKDLAMARCQSTIATRYRRPRMGHGRRESWSLSLTNFKCLCTPFFSGSPFPAIIPWHSTIFMVRKSLGLFFIWYSQIWFWSSSSYDAQGVYQRGVWSLEISCQGLL